MNKKHKDETPKVERPRWDDYKDAHGEIDLDAWQEASAHYQRHRTDEQWGEELFERANSSIDCHIESLQELKEEWTVQQFKDCDNKRDLYHAGIKLDDWYFVRRLLFEGEKNSSSPDRQVEAKDGESPVDSRSKT